MEVFEKRGIKIPNTVLIEGAPDKETAEEELAEFLGQYGSIEKWLVIDEADSVFNKKCIVEFKSGLAIAELREQHILPYTLSFEDNTYIISDLSSVSASEIGIVKTNSYLSELQNIAKLTGKNYSEVLSDVMSLLGNSVAELGKQNTEVTEEKPSLGSGVTVTSRDPPPARQGPSTQPQVFIPPVVDLRTVSEMFHFSNQRLRVFSGRQPRPQNEIDYDTWRSAVDLMLNDPSVSDLQRTRRIMESLLPPAIDLVKQLRPDSPPSEYLSNLDSAYGVVQDGEELSAKFWGMCQNTGEKSSAYLQRLQIALSAAVKGGGIPSSEVNRHLLAQFCRNCWDRPLISELQLKQRKSNPPSFSELLLLVRTEEDREAAKLERMKQHLGPAKAKAHAHYAYPQVDEKPESITLENLAKQLADIQRQLAAITATQSQSSKPTGAKSTTSSRYGESQRRDKPQRNPPSVPKPGYCFRCGEDGHIRTQCDSPPNSTLVAAKKKQFAERQSNWQRPHSSTDRSLN